MPDTRASAEVWRACLHLLRICIVLKTISALLHKKKVT